MLADRFFDRSKSGAIWGAIYFTFAGDGAFPDTGWTDLVAAFLRAWLNALIRIAQGTSVSESIDFFDGPLSIELHSERSGMLNVVFLRREKPEAAVEELTSRLLSNGVQVAKTLLVACKERNWQNTDTAVLTSLIEIGSDILHPNGDEV